MEKRELKQREFCWFKVQGQIASATIEVKGWVLMNQSKKQRKNKGVFKNFSANQTEKVNSFRHQYNYELVNLLGSSGLDLDFDF